MAKLAARLSRPICCPTVGTGLYTDGLTVGGWSHVAAWSGTLTGVTAGSAVTRASARLSAATCAAAMSLVGLLVGTMQAGEEVVAQWWMVRVLRAQHGLIGT